MRNDVRKDDAGGVDSSRKAAEDLLKGMDLRDKAEAAHEPEGILGKINDMATFARRANKVWDAARDLYKNIKPVADILLRPVTWTYGHLKDIFMYNAFEHNAKGELKLDAQGDLIFAPGRMARSFAMAAMLGNMAFIGGAGMLFHATNQTVYSYVTNKQMKVPGELYEVTGAESLPTSTELDNGMYYHVSDSLIYPALWRPEEDVYALIPQGNAVCRWEVHGIYVKSLKWLHKQVEFYQQIYDTACYPLSDAMINTITINGILPQQMFDSLQEQDAARAAVAAGEYSVPSALISAEQTPVQTVTPNVILQQLPGPSP